MKRPALICIAPLAAAFLLFAVLGCSDASSSAGADDETTADTEILLEEETADGEPESLESAEPETEEDDGAGVEYEEFEDAENVETETTELDAETENAEVETSEKEAEPETEEEPVIPSICDYADDCRLVLFKGRGPFILKESYRLENGTCGGSLRARVNGVKSAVDCGDPQSSEGTLTVYAPKLEGSAYSLDSTVVIDAAPDDSSPQMKSAEPLQTELPPKRAEKIIQSREASFAEYWALYHPSGDGRLRDCWASKKITYGQSKEIVYEGFAQDDEALEVELELWGASAFQREIDVSLNGLALGTIKFGGFETSVETLAAPFAKPDASGKFALKITLASRGGSPADSINVKRATLRVRGKLDGASLPLLLESRESEAAELDLSGVFSQLSGALALDVTDQANPLKCEISSDGNGGYYLPGFFPSRKYFLCEGASCGFSVSRVAFAPPEKLMSEEAELIIVSPAPFIDALKPLMDDKKERGIATAALNSEDVYAAFDFGAPTPAAIASMLDYAAAKWNVKPKALLLIGDASTDLNGVYATDMSLTIPTNYVYWSSGLWMSTDAVYNISVDDALAGEDKSRKIAVGRIPARTVPQLNAAIKRALTYSAAGKNGVLYMSDDNDVVFKQMTENIKNELPPRFNGAALHMDDYNKSHPLPNPPPANQWDEPAAAAMRADLIKAMTAGLDWVQYYGHGDLNQIAGEGIVSQNPDYYNLDETTQNGGFPPLFFIFNCLSGYFGLPALQFSLAESMVIMEAENAGAAAVVSPSAYGSVEQSHDFGSALQKHLTDGSARWLGEAFEAAAMEIITNPPAGSGGADYVVLTLTYSLLGDPTLPVPFPQSVDKGFSPQWGTR